jgi:AraC-like DNA-binding protein
MLEAHAARLLEGLESARITSTQVSRLVVEELEGGEPTLARIASRLALSPRTLQRRLADEQTTFADVLDETRRHMAQAYVQDRGLALTEVAYLLGFSEQSAFTRAFQRWWGMPPRQFRSAGISRQ